MGAAVGAHRYRERLERVRTALADDGDATLLVGTGPELEWLTGYRGVGHERLNLLVVAAQGRSCFIAPRLELGAARSAPGLVGSSVELVAWEETDDPFALLPPLVPASGVSSRCLVSDGLRSAFLLGLQAVLPGATWGLASTLLAPLRRIKDADELALLHAAAAAADRTIEAVLSGPLVGRREAEVAREVRDRLIAEGHDSAEFAIVAAGPNTASPHHDPGDDVITAGAPLLLDIGGRFEGYCSDVTRTAWVGGRDGIPPAAGFRTIYELTRRAQATACEAVRPGISFASLDATARDVIAAGGFGQGFIHRLGHGIGLEVHEEPYVVAGNADLLAAGDTFSCEPGIYLEGTYGVRIEDIVVCTADGGESLNGVPRELRVIGG